MRIMSWNILHGGREPNPTNLGLLTEVVTDVRPDVLVLVETYGSGEIITRALDAATPPGVTYQGCRITQAEPGRDNLWLVHRFERVRSYLDPAGISTFHFGGLRLRDDVGAEFDVFACWLNYLARHRVAIEAEAAARRAGRPRPYGDDALAALDEHTRDARNPAPEEPVDRPHECRLAQARRVLDTALPGFVGESPAGPLVLAGDFNCLSCRDWSEANRDLPRHHGIAVRWPVTAAFEDAGFRDAFRTANPDVGSDPGGTRMAPEGSFAADYRIDYVWTRGGIDVRDAWLVDERLPRHGPGPFYSDHAALVAELDVAPPRGER